MRVLSTPEAIGEDVAERLLGRIERARESGKTFLLGCPTGRTPRPVYAAMGRRLDQTKQDIAHLVLVMMDEYLVDARGGGLEYAPADQPWSCHHFARMEIAAQLNAGLPGDRQLRESSIWFPDPRDPSAYETRMADAGGIDFFMLASGASDGHVAFNPPGSAREAMMIVWGAGKRETLARMLRAERYEPEWPATVIHEFAVGEIVSDAEAAAGLEDLTRPG